MMGKTFPQALIDGFAVILAAAIFSLPLRAVDHKWHADATRLAMKSQGFSDDARLLAQFTNFLIDLHAVIDEYGPMLDEKIGSFLWMLMLEGGQYRLSPEDMARLHFDELARDLLPLRAFKKTPTMPTFKKTVP